MAKKDCRGEIDGKNAAALVRKNKRRKRGEDLQAEGEKTVQQIQQVLESLGELVAVTKSVISFSNLSLLNFFTF